MVTSAGAIIFNTTFDKVFLINKTERNEWNFPKGRLEANETPLEAANREITEETGLISFKLFDERLRLEYENNGEPKQVYFYLCKANDRQARSHTNFMDEEGLDGKWIDYKEALVLLTHIKSRELLCEAYAKIRDL
jgi:8-oxo-dGTP pyrophosphatase MutT (NUDIX family)